LVLRISENVLLLGNGHFNHYIVGTTQAVLIEGGMSAGIPSFKQQWESLETQPEISHILALHSHFDHICGIPAFRHMFPQALVCASAGTKKLLSKEKVCEAIRLGDQLVSDVYYKDHRISEKLAPIDTALLKIDEVVGEGDVIQLGSDLTLQIIETPGHSSCSISAYLPQEEIMFVSDAAGTAISPEVIAPVFFQDYDLYLNSIRKLMDYPTKVLAVGHGEVIIGTEQVQSFYQRSLHSAQEAFEAIKDKLMAGTDVEELARQLYDQYMTGGLADYPAPVMLGSLSQLINNVAKRI
jgi:glyoxylase-like metal-dependent hydrolase (beta-lactamase superfamily II)